jgi:hypothetical protein
MTVGLLFAMMSAAAIPASLLVVLLLRRQLRRLLVDLCDGEHRAEFWVSVSTLWIVLVGLLSGSSTLGYWRGDGGTDLFGGATSQVRFLLVGLLGAVLAIAVVLMSTIRRRDERHQVGRWGGGQPPPRWSPSTPPPPAQQPAAPPPTVP